MVRLCESAEKHIKNFDLTTESELTATNDRVQSEFLNVN